MFLLVVFICCFTAEIRCDNCAASSTGSMGKAMQIGKDLQAQYKDACSKNPSDDFAKAVKQCYQDTFEPCISEIKPIVDQCVTANKCLDSSKNLCPGPVADKVKDCFNKAIADTKKKDALMGMFKNKKDMICEKGTKFQTCFKSAASKL